MNILLTSAGRRTYMVDYFKEALRGEGLVFVANSVMSPAMYRGDGHFLTPLIYQEDYIPFLLDLCREKKIGLLVSLFDIDLPVLSAHRDAFAAAGTTVAVSDPETLACCNDKFRMFRVLGSAGIPTPRTWLDADGILEALHNGETDWPLYVKPRFGMGSLGVLKARSEEEFRAAFSMCENEIAETYLRFESAAAPGQAVIAQEQCAGNEYGLGVISDLQGRYVTTIVRRKMGMRSGETDEAVILGPQDPAYEVLRSVGERLAALLQPKGLIDVDVMMDERRLVPFVIDMNARFGGGYPFSHLAGADVPRAYVLWMQGRDSEADAACRSAEPGVHGFKDISIMRMKTGGDYA